LNVRNSTWPTLLCACAFATASHAFFPVDVASRPLHRVASTAPVDQLRTIPEDAKKGAMWPPDGRRVRINDKIMVLAPGATIRDMNNRVVLPNTIRNPKKIRYTVDQYGQVKRIWISPTGEYTGRHGPTKPPEPRED